MVVPHLYLPVHQENDLVNIHFLSLDQRFDLELNGLEVLEQLEFEHSVLVVDIEVRSEADSRR